MCSAECLTRFQTLAIVAVGLVLACAPADDVSANKAIVRGYLETILNEGNLAAVDDYFPTEGFRLNGRLFTPDAIGDMRASIFEAFPDFRVTIEDQIAEGDKVATRVTFRGTHQGEFNGIAATGREVSYMGIAIDSIAGGKVVEGWHRADELGLLRQLGALPESQ